MKYLIFALVTILAASCDTINKSNLYLQKIQESNPEISELSPGTGFENDVLRIQPHAKTQSLVIWEGEDASVWEDANYLVCEVYHANDFSGVLNLEFFRNENANATIGAQSGEEAGDETETPRMAAKIGVLPKLKTKMIFPLEHLNGQEIFMPRFPRQLKGTVLGSRMKPTEISKVAIDFAPFMEPYFMPEFEVASVYLTKEVPEPFPDVEVPVVDSLGQWTARDWPGKTKSKSELKNLLEQQLATASSSTFPENWNLNLESFEALTRQVFEEYPSEKAKDDFWQFSEILVKKYVDEPCDEVEKVDPDHLNLGMRYAWISSGLLYKAGDRFDVFSINGYGNPGPPETAEIAEISGKPVMIGEFHFGAIDRGLPATGIQGALNQEARGKAYRYYLEQGLARPELIGIHYFQWLDQPIFGRFDGENYNIGFMDICNRPYKELINAAKESHLKMYEIANGQETPFDEVIQKIPSVHY